MGLRVCGGECQRERECTRERERECASERARERDREIKRDRERERECVRELSQPIPWLQNQLGGYSETEEEEDT